jgi:NADPH-dependent 2,4-dienoyl-CoA reductase/sulfur reductase-like enzyme
LPEEGRSIQIHLEDGRSISAELAIPATGQIPNTQLLANLASSSGKKNSIVNPINGFIRVRPTLQFHDPAYPNLFAVGDVADSGANKAARPGAAQAAVMAKNVLAMINGQEPTERIVVTPPGIHLSLGLVS